jgi:hypothetical protein
MTQYRRQLFEQIRVYIWRIDIALDTLFINSYDVN